MMEGQSKSQKKETLHGLCYALEDRVAEMEKEIAELERQIGLASPDTMSQSKSEEIAAQTPLEGNLTRIHVRLDDLLSRLNSVLSRLNSVLGAIESCQKILG